MQDSTEKSRVFLDSSVLIAATLSLQGGSFYILTQLARACEFKINDYVLQETTRVLATKFRSQPTVKTNFFLLIGVAAVLVLPNPPPKQVRVLTEILNPADAPILASALLSSSYLITLDNDFLTQDVVAFAQKRSLTILKPSEFIALQRKGWKVRDEG